MKKTFLFLILLSTLSLNTAFADYQKTYTMVDVCYGSGDNGCIIVKGASNKQWKVEYATKLGVKTGETLTVLFDNDDKWKKITRDYNGLTASIVYVTSW